VLEVEATIGELHRVLKPGGLAIITVPQSMKNHSGLHPSSDAHIQNFDPEKFTHWRADYWRFTKYGLVHLFRNFQIAALYESNGYFGTLAQFRNYFFVSLTRSRLLRPLYLINNLLGVGLDWLFGLPRRSGHPLAEKFYQGTYISLTTNLILIVRKP